MGGLEVFLDTLKNDESFSQHVTYWGVRKKGTAVYSVIPSELHPKLKEYLE